MAICRLLVDAGANPNSESKHPLDRTILISAVSFLPDLVPTLLEAGADPDAANFYGETPLHYAASYGLADPVEALLKAGANPNSETKAGESPLHRAAAAGAIPCIEALLRAGADHGIVDYGGRTLGDVAKDDETRNTMARILCEMEAETLSTGVEAPPPARRSRII
jgi:ankyrin repeat protein